VLSPVIKQQPRELNTVPEMADSKRGFYVGTHIKVINLLVYESSDFRVKFCWFEQLGKEIQWDATGNENRNSEQVVGPAYVFLWSPSPPSPQFI
jgi:hypothetical protein